MSFRLQTDSGIQPMSEDLLLHKSIYNSDQVWIDLFSQVRDREGVESASPISLIHPERNHDLSDDALGYFVLCRGKRENEVTLYHQTRTHSSSGSQIIKKEVELLDFQRLPEPITDIILHPSDCRVCFVICKTFVVIISLSKSKKLSITSTISLELQASCDDHIKNGSFSDDGRFFACSLDTNLVILYRDGLKFNQFVLNHDFPIDRVQWLPTNVISSISGNNDGSGLFKKEDCVSFYDAGSSDLPLLLSVTLLRELTSNITECILYRESNTREAPFFKEIMGISPSNVKKNNHLTLSLQDFCMLRSVHRHSLNHWGWQDLFRRASQRQKRSYDPEYLSPPFLRKGVKYGRRNSEVSTKSSSISKWASLSVVAPVSAKTAEFAQSTPIASSGIAVEQSSREINEIGEDLKNSLEFFRGYFIPSHGHTCNGSSNAPLKVNKVSEGILENATTATYPRGIAFAVAADVDTDSLTTVDENRIDSSRRITLSLIRISGTAATSSDHITSSVSARVHISEDVLISAVNSFLITQCPLSKQDSNFLPSENFAISIKSVRVLAGDVIRDISIHNRKSDVKAEGDDLEPSFTELLFPNISGDIDPSGTLVVFSESDTALERVSNKKPPNSVNDGQNSSVAFNKEVLNDLNVILPTPQFFPNCGCAGVASTQGSRTSQSSRDTEDFTHLSSPGKVSELSLSSSSQISLSTRQNPTHSLCYADRVSTKITRMIGPIDPYLYSPVEPVLTENGTGMNKPVLVRSAGRNTDQSSVQPSAKIVFEVSFDNLNNSKNSNGNEVKSLTALIRATIVWSKLSVNVDCLSVSKAFLSEIRLDSDVKQPEIFTDINGSREKIESDVRPTICTGILSYESLLAVLEAAPSSSTSSKSISSSTLSTSNSKLTIEPILEGIECVSRVLHCLSVNVRRALVFRAFITHLADEKESQRLSSQLEPMNMVSSFPDKDDSVISSRRLPNSFVEFLKSSMNRSSSGADSKGEDTDAGEWDTSLLASSTWRPLMVGLSSSIFPFSFPSIFPDFSTSGEVSPSEKGSSKSYTEDITASTPSDEWVDEWESTSSSTFPLNNTLMKGSELARGLAGLGPILECSAANQPPFESLNKLGNELLSILLRDPEIFDENKKISSNNRVSLVAERLLQAMNEAIHLSSNSNSVLKPSTSQGVYYNEEDEKLLTALSFVPSPTSTSSDNSNGEEGAMKLNHQKNNVAVISEVGISSTLLPLLPLVSPVSIRMKPLVARLSALLDRFSFVASVNSSKIVSTLAVPFSPADCVRIHLDTGLLDDLCVLLNNHPHPTLAALTNSLAVLWIPESHLIPLMERTAMSEYAFSSHPLSPSCSASKEMREGSGNTSLLQKDPYACLLPLLSTGMKGIQRARALFRLSPTGSRVQTFLSRDFSRKSARAAAKKNAFALLAAHRYLHAAAFFLLSGDIGQAVKSLCQRGWPMLALLVARTRVAAGQGVSSEGVDGEEDENSALEFSNASYPPGQDCFKEIDGHRVLREAVSIASELRNPDNSSHLHVNSVNSSVLTSSFSLPMDAINQNRNANTDYQSSTTSFMKEQHQVPQDSQKKRGFGFADEDDYLMTTNPVLPDKLSPVPNSDRLPNNGAAVEEKKITIDTQPFAYLLNNEILRYAGFSTFEFQNSVSLDDSIQSQAYAPSLQLDSGGAFCLRYLVGLSTGQFLVASARFLVDILLSNCEKKVKTRDNGASGISPTVVSAALLILDRPEMKPLAVKRAFVTAIYKTLESKKSDLTILPKFIKSGSRNDIKKWFSCSEDEISNFFTKFHQFLLALKVESFLDHGFSLAAAVSSSIRALEIKEDTEIDTYDSTLLARNDLLTNYLGDVFNEVVSSIDLPSFKDQHLKTIRGIQDTAKKLLIIDDNKNYIDCITNEESLASTFSLRSLSSILSHSVEIIRRATQRIGVLKSTCINSWVDIHPVEQKKGRGSGKSADKLQCGISGSLRFCLCGCQSSGNVAERKKMASLLAGCARGLLLASRVYSLQSIRGCSGLISLGTTESTSGLLSVSDRLQHYSWVCLMLSSLFLGNSPILSILSSQGPEKKLDSLLRFGYLDALASFLPNDSRSRLISRDGINISHVPIHFGPIADMYHEDILEDLIDATTIFPKSSQSMNALEIWMDTLVSNIVEAQMSSFISRKLSDSALQKMQIEFGSPDSISYGSISPIEPFSAEYTVLRSIDGDIIQLLSLWAKNSRLSIGRTIPDVNIDQIDATKLSPRSVIIKGLTGLGIEDGKVPDVLNWESEDGPVVFRKKPSHLPGVLSSTFLDNLGIGLPSGLIRALWFAMGGPRTLLSLVLEKYALENTTALLKRNLLPFIPSINKRLLVSGMMQASNQCMVIPDTPLSLEPLPEACRFPDSVLIVYEKSAPLLLVVPPETCQIALNTPENDRSAQVADISSTSSTSSQSQSLQSPVSVSPHSSSDSRRLSTTSVHISAVPSNTNAMPTLQSTSNAVVPSNSTGAMSLVRSSLRLTGHALDNIRSKTGLPIPIPSLLSSGSHSSSLSNLSNSSGIVEGAASMAKICPVAPLYLRVDGPPVDWTSHKSLYPTSTSSSGGFHSNLKVPVSKLQSVAITSDFAVDNTGFPLPTSAALSIQHRLLSSFDAISTDIENIVDFDSTIESAISTFLSNHPPDTEVSTRTSLSHSRPKSTNGLNFSSLQSTSRGSGLIPSSISNFKDQLISTLGIPTAMAWALDGSTALIGTAGGFIRVLDPAAPNRPRSMHTLTGASARVGELVQQAVGSHSPNAFALSRAVSSLCALRADAKIFAVGSAPLRTVLPTLLWDRDPHSVVFDAHGHPHMPIFDSSQFHHRKGIHSMNLSGTNFSSNSSSSVVHKFKPPAGYGLSIFDTRSGRIEMAALEAPHAGVTAIHLDASQINILCGSEDGSLSLFDIRGSRVRAHVQGVPGPASHPMNTGISNGYGKVSSGFAHLGPVSCISMPSHGSFFVTGGQDGDIHFWDPELDKSRVLERVHQPKNISRSGYEIGTWTQRGGVTSLAFINSTLISSGQDGNIFSFENI